MTINLWDKNKSFTYIKLGSFFLVAILIFFAAILSIREISIFKGSYIVIVKFGFAEGLRTSSPVRFCGVDVGEVKKVLIKEDAGESKVYVYSKVQEGVKIPKNSYFFVNSLSLFGEKYLEIAADIVEMEKANLDKLENILHEKMKTSDQNDRTILSIIRIQERRSKLLGLDAPVKTFVEMNVPEPIQFVIEG